MSVYFDEGTHTDAVIAFYRAMEAALPEERREAMFLKCVQQYGEERGRRMAMRALRMGYALDFNAYQACGEWAPTRPELSDSRPGEPIEGASHTLNYHCLWCERFLLRGAGDVGRVYCAEIDRSIVRGFNPDMRFELRGYKHTGEFCDFVFGPYDPSVRLERPAGGVKDFEYHTAHTYHSFAHTLRQSCSEGEEIVSSAARILESWHGPEIGQIMNQYRYDDFTGIE